MFRKQFILLGLMSGVLLAALGILAAIGSTIPLQHDSRSEREIALGQDKLWAMVSEPENMPQWNSSLLKVEPVAGKANFYREYYQSGDAMTYETLSSTAPSQIVRRIAEEDAPFQGQWTISLEAIDENHTKVVIEEKGSIKNPFLRFMAHHVLGLTRFQDSYLKALDLAAKS